MADVSTPEVWEWRIRALEADRAQLLEAVQTIVKLELRHEETRHAMERAFGVIKEHDGRMRILEEAMPLLRLTSNWVVLGVLGILSLVGMNVWRLVGG